MIENLIHNWVHIDYETTGTRECTVCGRYDKGHSQPIADGWGFDSREVVWVTVTPARRWAHVKRLLFWRKV